jgi:signal transduction histidine kinase/ligand-binding sensor domain-containing protein/DNA-binding NarL/FixJ family response regulator
MSVLAIYQDRLGYMWFGTREGLNRYDGNSVKVILSTGNDTSELSSNIINTICGNGDDLYIHCGYHYLSAYNMTEEKYTLIDNNCQHVAAGEKGLWLSSQNRLKLFDYTRQKLVDYYSMPSQNKINCLFEAASHKLYIGTDSGLYMLDERKIPNLLLSDNHISCIYEDSKQNIWAGTNGNGVYKINRNGLVNAYTAQSGTAGHRLSNNIIRAFCEDNSGQIWIATFDGLNRMIPETGQIVVYRHTDSKPTGLSHNSIHTLYKDKQGTLWIGTYFGGINYYNPECNVFTYYYPDAGNARSVNFPIVGKMAEDRNHNLWICTEGGGLNFFDRKLNTFKYYKAGGSNSISHNNLKCIHYHPASHKLCIGTHMGGLNIYDIDRNQFRHISTATHRNLPNDIIETLFPYDGKLIVLTQNGMVLFDWQTESVEPFLKNQLPEKETKGITNLYVDKNQNLWLCLVEGGLLRYNLQTKTLRTYTHDHRREKTIGQHPVNNIYETKNGDLLFSTLGSGLFKYLPETDNFEHYTAANNGFLSDFVYLATETNYGYLLLLTGNGVSLLNNSPDNSLHGIYNIDGNSGFPLTKISFECGVCIAQNGEVFIGGINGMASFFENRINSVQKDYDLFFSDLYIHNIRQNPSEHPGIMPQALPYLKNIRLKHNQTNIQINIATSNHIRQNNIPLEYKLTKFDADWLPVNDLNIRYSNLSPGKYTLAVRERAGSHPLPLNTPAKEIQLSIDVKPPLYASIPAYCCYIAIISLLLWWFIRSNRMKFRLKTSLEYEIRENNRIQELNQIKLQFFTNISHEFRTPLTLIIGQIESLLQMENLQLSIHKKLAKIHKNASHLRRLINELLDFRKQERDILELKVSENDIVAFAENVFNSFKDIAVKRQIEYTFFSGEHKILLWFDPVQLQKVFYNLLSNAFKYSGDNSTITLRIEKKQQQVVISIIDSGIGIGEEDLPKIFNRFYQAKTNSAQYFSGTGIGLALSKGIVDLHHGEITARNNPDKGCTFQIVLPTGSEHFTKEEKTARDGTNWEFFKERDLPQQAFFEEIKHIQALMPASAAESTILIVEDNEDLLDFLDEIFSPVYRVETAKDGFEGLEKVKMIQPDIVLSDILMPKMSGVEMCTKIKSNFETSHIPVILISADASEEQNLGGLMAGADDYITKPFNVKALVSRCNNLILSRKRMQERYSKHVDNAAPLTIATNKHDQELLNQATGIVLKYIDNPSFNINTFTNEMALGKSKLYLKIKGITGMTPNEFILNIRLKKAAALLLSDADLNISDITYRLGFSTPRYFSKCFKDLFGISPLNYRKANGNITEETGGDESEEEG